MPDEQGDLFGSHEIQKREPAPSFERKPIATDQQRRTAVDILREHWWLARQPPESKDATVADEMWIWERYSSRVDPEELNGALSMIREVVPEFAGEALTLRWMWVQPALFHRCLRAWQDAQEPPPTPLPHFDV